MKQLLIVLTTVVLASACGGVVTNDGAEADAQPKQPDGATPGQPDGATPTQPDASNPQASCNTDTHLCVPAIPQDWTGPVIYTEQASDAAAPSCPSGYGEAQKPSFAELDPGEAGCGCSCGDPTGISCGSASLRGYGTSSCTSGGGLALPPASVSTCQNTIPDTTYYRFTAPSVSGGSCTPSDDANIDTPRWGTRVTACLLTDSLDACGDGGDCAPKPPAEFDNAICIVRDGEHSCPAGDYSERFVRYTSYNDTRTCSGCSCGAPSGTCGGAVRLKHSASPSSCSGGTTDRVLLSPSSCGYAPSAEQATYTPDPVASCSAGSSQLSGGVAPAGAVTYCCTAP